MLVEFSSPLSAEDTHIEDRPLLLSQHISRLDIQKDREELKELISHASPNPTKTYVPSMEGVAIMISTDFITARHSFEDFPRMQSVHPLHNDPRTSQAHISNATFSSWATRIPGAIPTFPGFKQTTSIIRERVEARDRLINTTYDLLHSHESRRRL